MNETKQLRYIDLMQVVEAMLACYAPEILEKNTAYRELQAEFDCLAADLGYEDTAAILENLNRERVEIDDQDITLDLAPATRAAPQRLNLGHVDS